MATTLGRSFSNAVSFSVCSFVRPNASDRKKMVASAMSTWRPVLDLPFSERIFLDDHSPEFASSRLVETIGLIDRFDRVQYWVPGHASHSNFGIVASMSLANTPYILHLDDDVRVEGSRDDCFDEIERLVRVLDADPSILGINLLAMTPDQHEDWKAAEPYPGVEKLAYTSKFFGTAACLIRRSLLDRVPLDQIVGWGASQPDIWEILVSKDRRREFLISTSPPFSVPGTSYFVSAAGERSLTSKATFFAKRYLKKLGLRRKGG